MSILNLLKDCTVTRQRLVIEDAKLYLRSSKLAKDMGSGKYRPVSSVRYNNHTDRMEFIGEASNQVLVALSYEDIVSDPAFNLRGVGSNTAAIGPELYNITPDNVNNYTTAMHKYDITNIRLGDILISGNGKHFELGLVIYVDENTLEVVIRTPDEAPPVTHKLHICDLFEQKETGDNVNVNLIATQDEILLAITGGLLGVLGELVEARGMKANI